MTFGSNGGSFGTVTATAQTDATVTAAFKVNDNQTNMAIFAVPKQQEIRLYGATGEIAGGTADTILNARIMVKERADQADSGFLLKDGGFMYRNKEYRKEWRMPHRFAGPCIIKFQVTSAANNMQCRANLYMTIAPNIFNQDY